MFFALEIKENSTNSIWQRLLDRLKKPVPKVEMQQVLGTEYGLISVSTPANKIDWDIIADIVGVYNKRLLLPEGVCAPIELGVKTVSFPLFERDLLLHTACKLIEKTRMPMYRRVLGFVDKDCLYSDMLPVLLRYFTSVFVITNEREQYSIHSQNMMNELGAPVTVCDYGSLSGCVLVFSPAGGSDFACNCPVLSGAEVQGKPCGGVFLKPQIAPKILEPFCPKGISLHCFAGALYDFCGVGNGDFCVDTILVDYKVTGFGEAVDTICKFVSDQKSLLL